MPAYRDYRRWAFESAAADLALRQAGPLARRGARARAAADQLRRLAAARRPAERRAGDAGGWPPTPACSSSSTTRPPGTRSCSLALGRDRRRRVDRLQGRLQGHAGRRRHRSRPLPPLRRDLPGRVARGSRPDRSRGRRGAAPASRPDHLGRADPRRRRHRGAAVPAADDQRQAVADRHLEEAAAHVRVVRRARHHQLRRRPVRAGRRPRPDPVPRVDLPRRRGERHRARRATTGPSSRRPACPPNPLPPRPGADGFRRRS